jgi:type I restriction enzyme M protein
VATIEEVKKAGYSLNPGRYVGVTDNGNGDDGNFGEKVKNLHSELKGLTDEAHELESKVFENLKKLDI